MKLRLTIDLHLGRDEPEPQPERESGVDALVERAEPHPVGFTPQTFPGQEGDIE